MAQYKVQAPDGSIIRLEGPEGASQEEVLTQAKRLYAQRAKPDFTAPTTETYDASAEAMASGVPYTGVSSAGDATVSGLLRGAVYDPIAAVRQLVSEEQRKKVAKEESLYQEARRQKGDTGFEGGRLLGGIVSPANVLLPLRAAQLVTRGGRIGQVATAGAVSGALQPTFDIKNPEDAAEFIESKIEQVGLGALTGALADVGITVGGKAIDFVKDLRKPLTEAGRKEALQDILTKLTGDQREQIVEAARNVRPIVPGSMPTVAEAIADLPAATGLAAQQRRLAGDFESGGSALFATRAAEQEAARLAAVRNIGQDEAALAALQAERAAVTGPLREEALSQANIAGTTVGPRLEAELAARQASMVDALQQQGQLQTLAAQQAGIAQQPFAPMAAAGVPAISGRYSVAATTAAEAIDAAKLTGNILAQRQAEVALRKTQVQSLADEGFYPLKVDPVVQRIDQILRNPGDMASDVTKDVLSSLRAKLDPTQRPDLVSPNGVIDSRNLYTIRKEIADDINQFAKVRQTSDKRNLARLETGLKGVIDDAIEKAGGTSWKNYLSKYADYSTKINRIKIGQYLEGKLKTSIEDKERAGAFATAIKDAPTTIQRATGGARYEELGDILLPKQVGDMNAVYADLQRLAKANASASRTRVAGLGEAELVSPPAVFNQTMTIVNKMFSKVKGNALTKIDAEMAQLLANPQQFVKFMEAIPKERAQGIMSVIFPRLSPESRVLLRNILATEALVEAETLP